MKNDHMKSYSKLRKQLDRENEELLKLLDGEEDEEDEGDDFDEDEEFIPYSEFKNMTSEEFASQSSAVRKPVPVTTPSPKKEEKNILALIICLCIAFTCFGFAYYMDHVVGDFMITPIILGGLSLIIGIILL